MSGNIFIKKEDNRKSINNNYKNAPNNIFTSNTNSMFDSRNEVNNKNSDFFSFQNNSNFNSNSNNFNNPINSNSNNLNNPFKKSNIFTGLKETSSNFKKTIVDTEMNGEANPFFINKHYNKNNFVNEVEMCEDNNNVNINQNFGSYLFKNNGNDDKLNGDINQSQKNVNVDKLNGAINQSQNNDLNENVKKLIINDTQISSFEHRIRKRLNLDSLIS